MRRLIKSTIALALALVSVNEISAVTADINSGDPAFPFPQFLPYNNGQILNLANVNPEGVPHEEMEKRIREAWQIMCNNIAPIAEGVVVDGVPYLHPNGPTECTCVESDGYFLQAAAYMADRTTFNGLYMQAHDRGFHKTRRFHDGVFNTPNYLYGQTLSGAGSFGAGEAPTGGGTGGDAATDGDVDVGLGLLVAYKQWGNNSGITLTAPGWGGIEMSYYDEAVAYLNAMVDTTWNPTILAEPMHGTGDVGLDGYFKNGNTWGELTNWASGGYMGITPEYKGPAALHVDYIAPAYFNCFARFFEAEGLSDWSIHQMKRAEASSDWLIEQMRQQGLIAHAGWVSLDGANNATFSSFADGEDFRTSWRTILNYMWHGNPTTTWNPVTHEAEPGGNTFEQDMAVQHASYVLDPQSWGNGCMDIGESHLTFMGPPSLLYVNTPEGNAMSSFPLNFSHGTGSPAVVSVQDFDGMAQVYRQCAIEWDGMGDGGEQKYIDSRPRYFHEWFRLLGLLVTTGNYHTPCDMEPQANMKVYKSVDKTFAFPGDELTYTLSYRNYGSLDAQDVVIEDVLPDGLEFVSSTGPGVSVNGQTVSWNIGTVDGFETGGLAATKGEFDMTVRVLPGAGVPACADGPPRVCNVATISCSNGSGWTSNEYPNNCTETMERNCVDILEETPLELRKRASRSKVNPGDTLSYCIVVKNKEVPFLNGGRPGVRIGFANGGVIDGEAELAMKFRFYHGAHQPYIDYSNYRISYYMNTPGPPQWEMNQTVPPEGLGDQDPIFFQQDLVPGPTWNHRFVLQFPEERGTISSFLYYYKGLGRMIHEGALEPPRLVATINAPGYPAFDFSENSDWSADPNVTAADGHEYFPVTDDWTRPDVCGEPVDKLHVHACEDAPITTDRILVEEWDGYTWRRIYGDAPVSGRELTNIQVADVMPDGVVFGGFLEGPEGTVNGQNITWPAIDTLLTRDSVMYCYWVTVEDEPEIGTCPITDLELKNIVSATATNEAEVRDSAIVEVTCDVIEPEIVPTTMYKSAQRDTFAIGDEIVYSLAYKQTHGTVVEDPDDGDWIAMAGLPTLNVAGGTVSLNSNYQNWGLVHKYSHGMNGTISGTLELAQYTPYNIVLRQDGNDYAEVRFNVQFANVEIELYQNGTQIGTTETIVYGDIPGAFDFQLKLDGPDIGIWVVNAGDGFPSFAPISFTGLDERAGYAGAHSTQGGNASLYNWYTFLDSGFDVVISDEVPEGVDFVSTTEGAEANGEVSWQVTTGDEPMLYNDSVSMEWTGTVTACADITNRAYTNMVGQPENSIGAEFISYCGDPPSCIEPEAELTAPLLEMCPGGELTLTATYNEDHQFTWYQDDVIANGTGGIVDDSTFLVMEAGQFYAMIVTETCTSYTDTVDIVITAPPVVDLRDTALCGDTLAVAIEDFAFYTWNTGATTSALTITSSGIYSITVEDAAGCTDADSMAVLISPQPHFSILGTDTVCFGDDADIVLSITSGTAPFDLSYSDGIQDYDLTDIDSGQVITVVAATSATYSPVSIVDLAGCEGTLDSSAAISVSTPPDANLLGGTEICLGDSATLDLVITGTGPFVVDYTNGTDTLTIDDVPDTHEWTVAPDATTTYQLVQVTDVAGCSAALDPSQTVEVKLSPSAEILGSTVLCAGEDATLEFSIEGVGPYDVIYTDGTDEFELTDIDSGHTVNITPADSVEYSLITVTAEQGADICAGPVTGVADIDVIALPDAVLSGDGAICDGDSSALTITTTGTGPFDIIYTDGTANYNLLGVDPAHTFYVAPDTTTTYNLISISDGSSEGCDGTVDGVAEVALVEAPEVSNIAETCDDFTLDFVVTFDITGGDNATYEVIGGTGAIVGGTFTSDPLASETNYSFEVFDAAGCDTILVEGFRKCDCQTDADAMDPTAISVCQAETATAIHNVADTANDGDDVLFYALHTGNGPNLGDVKIWSATPDFDYDPDSLNLGDTYYISAVMGNDDGGGQPDPTDVCLSVAPGTAVTFNPTPSATLTGAADICTSESTDLVVGLAGNGPFDVRYSDGIDTTLLESITDNFVIEVTPTTNTDYYLVDVSDNSTPSCSAPATDLVSIQVTEAPVLDAMSIACNGANTGFTVTLDISGGDQASYAVTGASGSLTGAQFISNEMPNGSIFNFTIKDDFACDSVVINDSHFCECSSEAGTMASGAPVTLCEGEIPTIAHNGDHVTDANDTLMFILHDSPTATIGEVFAISSTPAIGFNNAMEYGSLYWISPVVGNIDALNGIDLVGDFCLASAPGTPVLFNEIPTATISGGGTICAGSGQQAPLTFELTGVPPFDVVYQDQNGANFSLSGIENGHVELVSPGDSSTFTLVSVTDAGPAGCEGTVDGSAQVNVPGEMIISTIVVEPTCAGVCNGTIATDIEGGDGAYSYSWRFATGDTIPGITGALLTGLCADNYIVDIVDGAGCYASTQIEVLEPEVMDLTLDLAVPPSCPTTADGELHVSASGGSEMYDYQWSNGAAAAAAFGLTIGTYSVTATDQNGCWDTLTVELEFDGGLQVEATPDSTICADTPLQLNAMASGGTAPYSYLWEASPTLDADDQPNPTANPTDDELYIVRAFDASGCSSLPDTVDVQVYAPLQVDLTVAPNVVCAGDTVNVSTTIAGGATDLTILLDGVDNGDVRLIQDAPTVSHTYEVVVTDACGTEVTSTADVTVNPIPTPDIVINDSVPGCDGTSVTFTAENTGVLQTGSDCEWDFANGDVHTGCELATTTFTTSGEYAVEVSVVSEYGCAGTATVSPPIFIPSQPTPKFDYSPKELDQFNPTTNFTNQSDNGSTFEWTISDANGLVVDQLIEENPVYEFPWEVPGDYEVCLVSVNSLGCPSDPLCESVTVAGNFAIYIPTAFSPDGDGRNDVFQAKGIGIESFELLVFDRWGEMVFSTDNFDKFWDGIVKNSTTMAKSDVYTWKLTARSEYADETIERIGRVTLLK